MQPQLSPCYDCKYREYSRYLQHFLPKNSHERRHYQSFDHFHLSQTLRHLKMEKQQGVSASLLIVLLCLFRMCHESIGSFYSHQFYGLFQSGKNCFCMGHRSSRARVFHPHPLTEPCVKFSPHTALHTLCFVHMLLSSYPPLCLIVVQFQLLECVTPFAPCPLQTLQRYYGTIRHRRGLRYISALFVTFGISLDIPSPASHVPPTSLYYCPATSMPHAAMP